MCRSAFSRVTKHPLKDHRDVAHQIDGIIVHDDLPGKIVLFFRTRFLLDRRRANSGCCLTVWLCDFGNSRSATSGVSARAHGKNANIRRSQFKPREALKSQGPSTRGASVIPSGKDLGIPPGLARKNPDMSDSLG